MMYVCLSQAVCPSLSTFLSVCLSVCLSIGLPVCRSACLRLSVCLSVCLSDQAQAGCLSVTVGLSDSVCVCVCLQVSVCLSVFLSFSVVCLSVTSFCPSFCLFQTPSHSIGPLWAPATAALWPLFHWHVRGPVRVARGSSCGWHSVLTSDSDRPLTVARYRDRRRLCRIGLRR